MNISSTQITNNRLFSTSKFEHKDIVGFLNSRNSEDPSCNFHHRGCFRGW